MLVRNIPDLSLSDDGGLVGYDLVLRVDGFSVLLDVGVLNLVLKNRKYQRGTRMERDKRTYSTRSSVSSTVVVVERVGVLELVGKNSLSEFDFLPRVGGVGVLRGDRVLVLRLDCSRFDDLPINSDQHSSTNKGKEEKRTHDRFSDHAGGEGSRVDVNGETV